MLRDRRDRESSWLDPDRTTGSSSRMRRSPRDPSDRALAPSLEERRTTTMQEIPKCFSFVTPEQVLLRAPHFFPPARPGVSGTIAPESVVWMRVEECRLESKEPLDTPLPVTQTKKGANKLSRPGTHFVSIYSNYCRWLRWGGVASALLSSDRGDIEITLYSRSLLSKSSRRNSILSFCKRNCA